MQESSCVKRMKANCGEGEEQVHMHAPREINVEINKLLHCRITALQFFHFEKHLNKPLECTYT
tara:strand:+ start:93 stop:281 length:189 start_codon:yes stop_codon:yes gene_type:complete